VEIFPPLCKGGYHSTSGNWWKVPPLNGGTFHYHQNGGKFHENIHQNGGQFHQQMVENSTDYCGKVRGFA